MSLSAVVIDSREPEWVQALQFGGLPTTVMALETGDVMAVADDGCTLLIERKTPDDFLNSLRDARLMQQAAHLANARLREQHTRAALTTWPYIVITGAFGVGPNRNVVTARETGWSFNAVTGALLTLQEMGVFVAHCAGDSDFESCVLMLGNRARDPQVNILPPRPPRQLTKEYAVLEVLGIGADRARTLLQQCATLENVLNFVLAGSTDLPGLNRGDYRRITDTLKKEHTHG